MIWIIYKVTFPNGKIYIGQTSRGLEQRKIDHLNDAKYELTKNNNNKFHNAMLKHLVKITWETIEEAFSLEEALLKEAEYIEKFNSITNGYNCRTSKNGLGTVSEETKKKISKTVSIRNKEIWEREGHKEKRLTLSDSMKKRHASGVLNETKVKIAKVRSTPEQRKLSSNDSKKRYASREAREKMALRKDGRPFLVFKNDELIGRFISQAEACRQLGIPNNGHVSSYLNKGYFFKEDRRCNSSSKRTLYGYKFIYESQYESLNRSDK